MLQKTLNKQDYAAYLLASAYLITILFNFMLLEPIKLGNGNWMFTEREQLTKIGLGLFFLSLLLSILPAYFFISASLQTRIHLKVSQDVYGIGFRHMIYYFAWYQIGYGLYNILYMFVEWPMFERGTISAILEESFFHILMIGIFIYLFNQNKERLGFATPASWTKSIIIVLFTFILMSLTLDILVTYPFADFFNIEINSWREDQISQGIMLAKQFGLFNVILQILMIGIIVPIAEEIMFRGVFQSVAVKKFGAIVGILLSSLFFAVIHIDPALMAPLFIMGLILGGLRHYFNSIWVAIIFHALNNTYSILYQYFFI